MRFTDLQNFVDVVENGGMTQAATIKGVSQPGISRSIRYLEKRMQATLLRRTGRGVELTSAGIEFLAFAKSSLRALEEAQVRVLEVSGNIPDRLRIAIPSRLGGVVFPILYRRFMQELPEVTIEATEAFSGEMADGMNAGRFDLLVSYLPAAPGAGEGQPVFRECLYLVENNTSGSAALSPVSLKEAAQRPLLLNRQGNPYRRLIESAFSSTGCKLRVTREIDTTEGLLVFAREGEGATILPFSNFHAEVARGEVIGRRIINPEIKRNINLHIGRHLDRRTAALGSEIILRCLNEVAKQVRWSAI